MGERLTITLQDDNYSNVTDDHERTGQSKTEIVNKQLRESYHNGEPTLADSIIPQFGQGLFIAGWVVALLFAMIPGVGMSLLGLALVIGAKVDEHMKKFDVSATTALIQVLGA